MLACMANSRVLRTAALLSALTLTAAGCSMGGDDAAPTASPTSSASAPATSDSSTPASTPSTDASGEATATASPSSTPPPAPDAGIQLDGPLVATVVISAFSAEPDAFEGTGSGARISADALGTELQKVSTGTPGVQCDAGVDFAEGTVPTCNVEGTNGAWYPHAAFADAQGTPQVFATEWPLPDDLAADFRREGSILTWGPSVDPLGGTDTSLSGDELVPRAQSIVDGLQLPLTVTSCAGEMNPREGSYPRCTGTDDSGLPVEIVLLTSSSAGSGDPVDIVWYAPLM